MRRISIHSELHYTLAEPVSAYLAVLAAHGPRQQVLDEQLTVTPAEVGESLRRVRMRPDGHDLLRLVAEPGPMSLVYDATVRLEPFVPDQPPTVEVPFGDLPPDVLEFVHPSRYCESDRLLRLAERHFGDLEPGWSRVQAVCSWVFDRLDYVTGSSDGSTTAVDVLVEGAGVCRDFAHLAIALCRALNIPARYVSGYAVDLDPPDFHGFLEAYLEGDWYLFDATRMAPIDGLVRIASGRDAADVAVATTVGFAGLDNQIITVVDLDRSEPTERTTAPIATA